MLASWLTLGAAVEDGPTFEQLLNAPELRAYQSKPDYRSRMDLLRQVLERHGARARREVAARRYDELSATLRAVGLVADHGRRLSQVAADPRDFRSKKVKRLEIRLRKMIEMLQDLQTAPPFEYRSWFEDAIAALDEFRTTLLEGFFQVGEVRSVRPAAAAHAFVPSAPAAQRGLRSSVDGDQFTYEEEEAIRDAQELRPRVKVLLEIAEARLDETARRLSQRPWTGEDPNPLEYYTYAQLIRAYHRALRSCMIFVDEKVRFGVAQPKDVRNSLKKINEKMQEFVPQLEPLRKLALEREDEDLFVEVRQAMRVSEQALRGSQLGLGAPSR